MAARSTTFQLLVPPFLVNDASPPPLSMLDDPPLTLPHPRLVPTHSPPPLPPDASPLPSLSPLQLVQAAVTLPPPSLLLTPQTQLLECMHVGLHDPPPALVPPLSPPAQPPDPTLARSAKPPPPSAFSPSPSLLVLAIPPPSPLPLLQPLNRMRMTHFPPPLAFPLLPPRRPPDCTPVSSAKLQPSPPPSPSPPLPTFATPPPLHTPSLPLLQPLDCMRVAQPPSTSRLLTLADTSTTRSHTNKLSWASGTATKSTFHQRYQNHCSAP